MEGMEEKLNSILGDPEMMGKIMDMARSLTGSPEPQPVQVSAEPAPMLDPAMLQTIASMNELNGSKIVPLSLFMGKGCMVKRKAASL